MEIVRESIFVSAIRSFFNALLAMIGVLIGLFIIIAIFFSFAPPYTTSDTNIDMKFLPDAEGNSDMLPESAPAVLQISFDGVIGDGMISFDIIEKYLRLSRKGILKKDRVKAVLLYINSPGGLEIDSKLIYQAINAYKDAYKVPVFAFTPGLCASGGYMIACAADQIYAGSSGIVGSVGVLFGPMFNFWDFMQKHGITSLTLTDGKYKQKYPTFGPLPTPGQTASSYDDLAEITKESYSQFVDIVVKAREAHGLTKALLVDTFGAQVYSASRAKQYGYIDVDNATYNGVLSDLVKTANIEGAYQVIEFKEKRSPVEDLLVTKVDLLLKEAKSLLFGIPSEAKWEGKLLCYFDPSKRAL